MQSNAKTVKEYLESLPDERRKAISKVRSVIRKHLPKGYEEAMNWGMITYQVPLSRCPDTYNGQPLMYAALASQKQHMAVYLTSIYSDEGDRKAFEEAYEATGKRFDAGKSCVRFRRLDDLPLELIGETIASTPVDVFVERVQAVHGGRGRRPAKKAARKTAKKAARKTAKKAARKTAKKAAGKRPRR